MRKERIYILAAKNGTLTATYASSLKRLPNFKQKWQIILTYKAKNGMKYIPYAYKRLISLYGL